MRTLRYAFLLGLGLLWPSVPTHADITRTQTISLRAGWNSVFLEVQPERAKPSEVFASLPVETVACFVPGRIEAQYLRQPGDAPWRDEGWAVWHSASRPEAFLSNLHEIQARRAYLILARSDFTWRINGAASATALEWFPNTCTLTGLPVDANTPPTFAQFFAGSREHRRLRIFRLEAGAWRLIASPNSEKPRSGEAYWIQTDGASTYQGLLRVRLPIGSELDFDLHGGGRSIEFRNESAAAAARVRIEIVGGEQSLPLRQVTRDLSQLTTIRQPFGRVVELPALPAGATAVLHLEPHRDAMDSTRGATLLRVTDGRGVELWLPARARRDMVGATLATP